MKFEVSLDSMEKIQQFISGFCEENNLDMKIEPKACVCADEVCSNIIQYSGSTFLEVKLFVESDGSFVMEFTDDGKAFDPLKDAATPDVTAGIEEREIGGLGIFMVRKMSKSVVYQRKDECNNLVVKL